MAEIIASTLLKVVFQKLADKAMKQLVRAQGIHSELKKLERTLSLIQDLLNDASRKEITDKAVEKWLNSLQHLAYDIDDVLDNLATEAMHHDLNEESRSITSRVRKIIPTCCTNFLLSNKLHHKLDNITTKLQDLEKEKAALGLMVKDGVPKNMNRRNETGLPDASIIVGRHGDKEILLRKLLGDEPCERNFSIIPIVGLGGVGKTTLARLLYNEVQAKDHFELMIWVCVSDEFDIFKISKTIFQAVTMENSELNDLNQLQMALIEQLKDKRFLLVLDDIWSENYDDWENLVRPFHSGAPGSKIIMTTRKEQLLKKLGFYHLDHLKTLSHDDAMYLFAQHALGVDTFDSHPALKPQGEGIVKKCGGLPLALKAIGRLLRTKTDEEDWDDVLNSEIWGLENVDEIVPALLLSYHDLPACLKQLFAYCSLFPMGFLFDKEDLVLLWMAEGFFNQSNADKSAERLGHEYFEKLLSRSFFLPAPNDEKLFVMHDLMNDVATLVGADFFLRFDNDMEMENKALAKYRHMSFIREAYVGYQKFEAFKRVKNLRTFLAVSVEVKQSWEHCYISNKILVEVLPYLPLLRVLCLSGFRISEIPECIGSLKLLRYLNLSETLIKDLPESVGNLYNLQTLIVFRCWKLIKLPNSFLKLKNLRHFDMRATLLKTMPLGIGKLKGLQTLTMIIIGEDNGFSITELKELKNLRGKTCIMGLEKVKTAMHARDANLTLKKFSELELLWGDVNDGSRKETLEKDILNELKPRSDKLEKLAITSYRGTEFPNWVGDPSFLRLVQVTISLGKNCTSLPALGRLPLLKKLFIQYMIAVKFVGSELLGTTGVAFPSLEILYFLYMSSWEVWSTSSGVGGVVFPCLQELRIEDCPNLVDISLEVLPSLRVLKIDNCSDSVLRSLVYASSSITKLKIKSIPGLPDEVWGGVIKYFKVVEELTIERCDEIRYLWESEAKASKFLMNLRKLKLHECENLVSLGEKEDVNFGSNVLTSLRMLDVSDCDSMERCSCPNNIEKLTINGCSSITSVTIPTATIGGNKLKSLEIVDCKKLMGKELGGEKINNTSMPMLEYMMIGCLPNLKSMIELSYSIHLIYLIIEDCEDMESFPDLQLPNLTSLKHLQIRKCQSMDASFPRGNWPPKLCTLFIGGLKKPISEWGPQNFPTSLVELHLFGEYVSNFSQLSHLLPQSLIKLEIEEFEKLESLSLGLQHLTSLQNLSIVNCPNIIDIPQMLFPSLLSLTIGDCPKLKERTSERGTYYWPLISHIPCIEIY